MSTDRIRQPAYDRAPNTLIYNGDRPSNICGIDILDDIRLAKRIVIDLDDPEPVSPANILNASVSRDLVKSGHLVPSTDLKARDLNLGSYEQLREVRSAMDKPKEFSWPNLEDLLKNSRKRFFGIELMKNEESILNRYKPVKISAQRAINDSGFKGSLEDCFKLGKRVDSTIEVDNGKTETEQQENIEPVMSKISRQGDSSNKDHEPLSLIMSKSVRKMYKIEHEKADDVVRERYTPRKLQVSLANCDPAEGSMTLEDMLKNSKKKQVRFGVDREAEEKAEERQSCAEKAAEYMSQKSNIGKPWLYQMTRFSFSMRKCSKTKICMSP